MATMQSLENILSGRVPQEPPEVIAIKRFVREAHQADCQVTIGQLEIVIQVKSGALAGVLRPQLHTMRNELHIEQKLRLRIG